MMWIIFGFITIVATVINLYMYGIGRVYKLGMAAGLSFTALTPITEYSLVSNWTKEEDWSALQDVAPTMEVVS